MTDDTQKTQAQMNQANPGQALRQRDAAGAELAQVKAENARLHAICERHDDLDRDRIDEKDEWVKAWKRAAEERDEARAKRDSLQASFDRATREWQNTINEVLDLRAKLAAFTDPAPTRDAKADAIANAIRPHPQGFRGVGL
jgi:uncharacterized protein YdcH (DUF465 family)